MNLKGQYLEINDKKIYNKLPRITCTFAHLNTQAYSSVETEEVITGILALLR
jgi:hypothetical protein